MSGDSLKYYFWRKHLPSGRVSRGLFDGSHHSYFSDPAGFPLRGLQKAASEVIAKWNRQQPETWQYTVDFSDWTVETTVEN